MTASPTTQFHPPRTEAVVTAPAAGARRRGTLARYWRSNQVRWGIALLVITVLVALVGPLIAPYDPTKTVGAPYQAPNGDMLLGTDRIGRDVLSRVLHGGLGLLWMAPAATVLGVFIGTCIGLIAAYRGRGTDTALMRVMDVLLAFPGIILALLFVSMFGSSLWLLVLLTALILMPGVARVMRGATLPLNTREFVLWGRAVGLPARTILFREILPNITSPLLVEFGVRLMWSIGILATMSFLGYGIEPPTPDWGRMVSENQTGMAIQPYSVIAPIVCIIVFTVGGNLVAEGAARVIARTEGKSA